MLIQVFGRNLRKEQRGMHEHERQRANEQYRYNSLKPSSNVFFRFEKILNFKIPLFFGGFKRKPSQMLSLLTYK
jgi:hypothetical protein